MLYNIKYDKNVDGAFCRCLCCVFGLFWWVIKAVYPLGIFSLSSRNA